MASAHSTGVMPISSDRRPPKIRRESMSRPSSSVPSRWSGVPIGFRRFMMLDLSGSSGAIHGAKIAIRISSTMIAAQTTATLSRVSLSATAVQ